MNTNKAILLIIDGQNDFCDPTGSLYVNGAEKDMDRLSKMVNDNQKQIVNIYATLDSHQVNAIFHPSWWIDSNGIPPSPFTIISANDVDTGKWRAKNPSLQKWSSEYVHKLELDGKYALCIWMEHTLIGSWGACVYKQLSDALYSWERNRGKKVNYQSKGSNPYTESYSALKAEVEFSGDPTTMLNTQFIDALKTGMDILVGGEAYTHCVYSTLKDIIEEFSDEQVKQIVILEDCTSPVVAPGLEHLKGEVDAYFKSHGVRFSTSTTYFA